MEVCRNKMSGSKAIYSIRKNPDGSTTCVGTIKDGATAIRYHGPRVYHLGSASLAPGKVFSFNNKFPLKNERSRQKRAETVHRMSEAFRRDADDPQSVELAALLIEEDFASERGGNLNSLSENESALMSTQRWLISTLPFALIRQCVDVALLYRSLTAEYVPLLSKNNGYWMPNPQYIFSNISATEDTRPDTIALLNTLLELSSWVNVHVYSEPDKRILTAWRGFEFADTCPISNDMSPSEIIERVQQSTDSINTDSIMSSQVCYWCGLSSLAKRLQLCNGCKTVVYCSRECQVNDWKAFHKAECTQVQCNKADGDLTLGLDRRNTLGIAGEYRELLGAQIAPANSDSVWRGDCILLYVAHMGKDSKIGKKTKGLPNGWYVKARETSI